MSRFNLTLIAGITVLFLTACSDTAREKPATIDIRSTPKTIVVTIAQMKFSPAELHLNVGDTVLWINNDIVGHTVTEEFNRKWSSPVISAGKSWKSEVVKNAAYFCMIHPVMKGKLYLNK